MYVNINDRRLYTVKSFKKQYGGRKPLTWKQKEWYKCLGERGFDSLLPSQRTEARAASREAVMN